MTFDEASLLIRCRAIDNPADFYLGRGPNMVFLGSIWRMAAPSDLIQYFADVEHQADYETELALLDISHEWEWPWTNSRLTNWVYTFDAGRIWVCHFNRPWVPLQWALGDSYRQMKIPGDQKFPDMSPPQVNYNMGAHF